MEPTLIIPDSKNILESMEIENTISCVDNMLHGVADFGLLKFYNLKIEM